MHTPSHSGHFSTGHQTSSEKNAFAYISKPNQKQISARDIKATCTELPQIEISSTRFCMQKKSCIPVFHLIEPNIFSGSILKINLKMRNICLQTGSKCVSRLLWISHKQHGAIFCIGRTFGERCHCRLPVVEILSTLTTVLR